MISFFFSIKVPHVQIERVWRLGTRAQFRISRRSTQFTVCIEVDDDDDDDDGDDHDGYDNDNDDNDDDHQSISHAHNYRGIVSRYSLVTCRLPHEQTIKMWACC